MFTDVYLAEILNEIKVTQFQSLWRGFHLVCQRYQSKDVTGDFSIDHVSGSLVVLDMLC